MGQRFPTTALIESRFTPRSLRRWLVVPTLAFALTGSLSATALADDSAADHAKRARTAYDLQNWSTAIQEYQVAYAMDQKPEYLFGLGQAQRQSGDFTGAIASFKAYKRADSVTPQQATAAELLITKCEAEQTKRDAEATQKKNDANAPPSGAAAAPGTTPSTRSTQSAPPPSDGPKHFYQDVFGDVLVGLGLVGGGVGTYFLISGNSDMSATAQSAQYRDSDSGADKAKTKQTVGVVTMSAGGALLAGGVIRWILVSGPKKDAGPATGFFVGPSSVGVLGRF